MSQLEDGKRQWWRWPFVLLVPPIAAFAAAFIFHWMQWFGMKFYGGYSEDGWAVLYVAPLFTAFMFGWFYAWAAALIAPSMRFLASLIMSALLMAFGVFVSSIAIFGEQYPAYQAVSVSIMTLAGSGGMAMALVQIHKDGGIL